MAQHQHLLSKKRKIGKQRTPESENLHADSVGKMHRTLGNKATAQLLQNGDNTHNADTLNNMQSIIGNKATIQLLQRVTSPDTENTTDTSAGENSNEVEPAQNLLSREQVDKALFYYASRSQTYTPTLITQIQQAVGATPDGIMGEETVQAVARHQNANPPLTVDGMAGPRTLPAVFKQGLDNEAQAESFDKFGAHSATTTAWMMAESPFWRLQIFVDMANIHLMSLGIPLIDGQTHEIQNREDIMFRPHNWKLWGYHYTFASEALNQVKMDNLVQDTYREMRRAEQYFSMARMLASRMDAAAIAENMKIPERVAQAAADNPLTPDTPEFAVAEAWYASRYGEDKAKHHAVMTEYYEAMDAYKAAELAYNNDASEANLAQFTAAKSRLDAATIARENLPEEQDIERVSRVFTGARNKRLSTDD